MAGPLMTAEDVAGVLNVSKSWVYAQSRLGRIPTVALGRYRRYRRESIDAWIRDLEQLECAPRSRRRTAPATPDGASPPVRASAWRLLLSSNRAPHPVSGHVRLRQGPRGGVFYVKFRLPDGRQVQRKLGREWGGAGRPPAGYYTRKTAEAAMREILADAQRGRLPAQVRTGATFGDAAREWLRYVEHDRQLASSTVADYRNVVDKRLLPEFGAATRLEAVTTERIDDYRVRLQSEARLSNGTIRKHLVVLVGIFTRAQRMWGLPSNPALGVDRPSVRRSADFRVLTAEDVEALSAVAESEQDAALFTTAAFTGLRMGELRALRWSDVDFSKRLVHVRRSFTRSSLGEPKSHKVRNVPMADRVALRLADLRTRQEYTEPDDLVFANAAGSFLDDSKVRQRYASALQRGGLKPLRFHDLRHTFGTLAVQAFPLSDVKAYMGHADIQTTMIYVHHVPLNDAAAKLSSAVGVAGDNPAVNYLRHVRVVRTP